MTKSLPLVEFWSEHRAFLFLESIPEYVGSVEGAMCFDVSFSKMHAIACQWETPREEEEVIQPFSNVSWFQCWRV